MSSSGEFVDPSSQEEPTGRLEFLNPAKSLELLATGSVGRVTFTESTLPVMHPVWYRVDTLGVVVRLPAGADWPESRTVGFQADHIDLGNGAGWTVTVVGILRPITNAAEVAKINEHGIRSWTATCRDRYMRIEATLVAGHRLPPASDSPRVLPAE